MVTSVVIGAPAAARSPAISARRRLSHASTPPTPAVLQAFLGLKDIHPISLVPAAAPTVTSPTPIVPAATSVQAIRLDLISNLETYTQAERLLKEGDELFRALGFCFSPAALQAGSRYDSRFGRSTLAAGTCPRCHASIRSGYKGFQTGNRPHGRSGPWWLPPERPLRAPQPRRKAEHLESLVDWAAQANTADRYFLVGLFLNYDNQAARA